MLADVTLQAWSKRLDEINMKSKTRRVKKKQ